MQYRFGFKRIVLFNGLLFLSFFSFGQIRLGYKEAANVNLDFFQSTKYQIFVPSYSSGIIFKYAKAPKWGLIQMDLNFVEKKFQMQKNDSVFDKIDSHVLHFNFLSHYEFGKNKFKYGFNVGPYLSYLLDANRKFSNADTAFLQQVLRSDAYSLRLDYGITGGLSFTYQFLYGDIQLDANFSMSYSSLTASLDKQAFDFRSNQLIQIGLAYLFAPSRLKKRGKSKTKD